jgi:iron complex outermembrane receptor protein
MYMRAYQNCHLMPVRIAGISLTAILFASTAAAQSGSTSAQGSTLGEVVVTAQKRSENIQHTPMAMTAYTGAQIERAQLSGPQVLQFSVPSMTYANVDGFTQITLRGVGTTLTGLAGESPVATYQDGVYTGSLVSESLPSFDLERIEVLRGPQGTLYGRNATGGVINYITRPPRFDPGATGSISYGNYNATKLDVGVTGPIISDQVAGRLSFHFDDHDGYRFNIAKDEPADAEQTFSGRGSILYRPSDNFSLTVQGDYAHQRSSNPYVLSSELSLDGITSQTAPLGVFSLPASRLATIPGLLSPADLASLNGGSIANRFGLIQPGPVAPDPSNSLDFSNADPTSFIIDSGGTGVTLDKTFDSIDIKSITGFRYSRLDFDNDTGGIGTPTIDQAPFIFHSEQFTQEFDVSGKAFDDRLDWLIGGYYFHDSSYSTDTLWLPAIGDTTIAQLSFAARSGPYSLNLSQPLLSNLFTTIPSILSTVVVNTPDFRGGGPLIANVSQPTTAFLGLRSDQTSQSIAGFGQMTFRLTDRLRFTAGARFTSDKKDIVVTEHSNLLATVAALTGTAPPLCEDERASKSWSAPTGTVGLDYDVAPHILTYAKASWGYKAGGFSGGCNNSFNPEYLRSVEGGIKSIVADGQLLVNVAVYNYDYQNIQFITYIPLGAQIENAGTATATGVEVEYGFKPHALRGFQLDGSVSYEDSHYGAGCFNDPASLAGVIPQGVNGLPPATCPAGVQPYAQIKGNQLIGAPNWKANFGAEYTFESATGDRIQIRGEAAFTDSTPNDIFDGKAPGQAAMTEPAYWISNARVTWTSKDGRYEGQLFVDNLTNTYYSYNRTAFNTPASVVAVTGQWAPPRTYGLRLVMKLGSAVH